MFTYTVNTLQPNRYVLTRADYRLAEMMRASVVDPAQAWEVATRALDRAYAVGLSVEDQRVCWTLGMIAQLLDTDRFNYETVVRLVEDVLPVNINLPHLMEDLRRIPETRDERMSRIFKTKNLVLLIVECARLWYASSVTRDPEGDRDSVDLCLDELQDALAYDKEIQSLTNSISTASTDSQPMTLNDSDSFWHEVPTDGATPL